MTFNANFITSMTNIAFFILGLLLFDSCTYEQGIINEPIKETPGKTGAQKFAAMHQLIRTGSGDKVPKYKQGDVNAEYVKAKNVAASRSGGAVDWIERGPGNVSGRTKGLVVDPDDPTARTWYVGSAGGGVWKTADAGEHWEHLTDGLTSMSTSTLTMSRSNTDVLYVGTGDFTDGPGVIGTGIWKSLDKGDTWDLLQATATDSRFSYVTGLIVDPADENNLVVSTISISNNNIYTTFILKSIDGGLSWEVKETINGIPAQQLVFSPQDFNTQYASINSTGILKSIDAGETWSYVWQPEQEDGIQRMEMAISPTNPDVIYLSCEVEGALSALYFTRDGFATMNKAVFEIGNPNWLSAQGGYDNTIAVHPYNDSLVWVGGVCCIMEIKCGSDFLEISVFEDLINNTTFIQPVIFPEVGTAYGLASDLLGGLPVDLETTIEDVYDVELRFGPGVSSKAHFISLDQNNFEFNYESMITIPFLAWDLKNDRQIGLSIIDLDGNMEWTFEYNVNDLGNKIDMLLTNSIDYTEDPHPTISSSNALYKATYVLFPGRTISYTGPIDELPQGNIVFRTKREEGLASEFSSVTDAFSPDSKGVHVDHHNLVFIPRDEPSGLFYVLNANDGGVAFSDDRGESFLQTGADAAVNELTGETFEYLTGYNTAQFYGLAKKNGESRYIGGTQDNASWISSSDPDNTTVWEKVGRGDGMEALWHFDNTDLLLATDQVNNLYKSIDEGETWQDVQLPQHQGPFITRLASSQKSPDLVFMVSDVGVLRSTDFADSWEIINMPDSWKFHGLYGPPIAISLADPNIIWTGEQMTAVESKMQVSVDGGLTFEAVSNYSQAHLAVVTGITTHPNDPNTAFVLFSQKDGPKILRTQDLGNTWEDISGFIINQEASSNGFPNVATYSLLIMPWNDQHLWAGTEIGLFESLDGGETWAYSDNGLPPLSIWQMQLVNDEIVIATHGRGIWTLDTDELNAVSSKDIIPHNIQLKVFPNPLTDQAVLSYALDHSENLIIDILDVHGRKVREIFAGKQFKGKHEHLISGSLLENGIYYVSLRSEHYTKSTIINVMR